MFELFDKKGKKLKKICGEYRRIFETKIPENVTCTLELKALKESKLEQLAYAFDELNGWGYVLKNNGNMLQDGLEKGHVFIPNLSREYPVSIHDFQAYGDEYIGVKLKGIKHRLRRLRYLRLMKEQYFKMLPPFNRYTEYMKPSPYFMQRGGL